MALSSIMTGAPLSANTSRQIAHVQHATKKQMDGHAGVLDAEIKLDSARGGDVTKKKEELEETQKKAAELSLSDLTGSPFIVVRAVTLLPSEIVSFANRIKSLAKPPPPPPPPARTKPFPIFSPSAVIR